MIGLVSCGPAAINRGKKPSIRICDIRHEAVAEGTSSVVTPAPSLCMNRTEGAAASTVQKIDARMDHLIKWTCAIPVAATNVSDVSLALKTFDGADLLLASLGFPSFCLVLALRFVRCFGLPQCPPNVYRLGSGASPFSNMLVGAGPVEDKPPDIRRLR